MIQLITAMAGASTMGGEHDDGTALGDGDAMDCSIGFWEWLSDGVPAQTAVSARKDPASGSRPQPARPHRVRRERLHAALREPSMACVLATHAVGAHPDASRCDGVDGLLGIGDDEAAYRSFKQSPAGPRP